MRQLISMVNTYSRVSKTVPVWNSLPCSPLKHIPHSLYIPFCFIPWASLHSKLSELLVSWFTCLFSAVPIRMSAAWRQPSSVLLLQELQLSTELAYGGHSAIFIRWNGMERNGMRWNGMEWNDQRAVRPCDLLFVLQEKVTALNLKLHCLVGLPIKSWVGCYYYPYFIDEKTNSQRGPWLDWHHVTWEGQNQDAQSSTPPSQHTLAKARWRIAEQKQQWGSLENRSGWGNPNVALM